MRRNVRREKPGGQSEWIEHTEPIPEPEAQSVGQMHASVFDMAPVGLVPESVQSSSCVLLPAEKVTYLSIGLSSRYVSFGHSDTYLFCRQKKVTYVREDLSSRYVPFLPAENHRDDLSSRNVPFLPLRYVPFLLAERVRISAKP